MTYQEPQRVVLKQYKDSFLIVKIRPDNSVHEYVVCRNWNGNSWDWGHYFTNIDDALEYFNEDRMGGNKYAK